ncbi:Starch-binding associating with outer membrane [Mucilaginibacter mallensis]|uniref:Starch-binding associating with outer membrane n=1 Tax=Mucilaginibacter mallensis TaxID=652787 RepID=A0A1H1VIS8_MUCMA|nr:RagB/SusD family nutrient uptake outer membrane protein [Mucilaginibacter mallensis]SDS84854.1 Starch-binding associating with outer membrane [Mucilaginibacter mallensis]
MKYFKKLFIATLAIIAVSSCKKLDLVPTNKFTDQDFWTTSINVNNALNNNYSLMYNSNLYFYNDDMSDNAYGSGNDPIATGSFNASTAKFINDWKYYYSAINSCNLFLAYVDQNKTLGADVIARMKCEVRFIRAWDYFNLMRWWGDVPLITSVITPDQAKVIGRSPRATVLSFVTSELEACAAGLPSKDQYAAADNGRITNGAALALEARVLLYEGNRMQDVVTICEKLMNNPSTYGNYSLASNYGALFSDATVNKTNTETMLALQYSSGTTGRAWSEDFDFAPISTGARVNSLAPTQELVNDYIMTNGKPITDPTSGYDQNNPYVNRDPRLTATIVYDQYKWLNPDGTTQIIYIKPGTDPNKPPLNEYAPGNEAVSQSGYYWRKYFDPNHLPGFVSGLNLQMIRWAEVLLDYAEAENSLGQMNADVWNKTIMALRQRAGFTDPNALNYPGNSDMTNIIMRERRTELAMEGLRTEDIRRWKLSETVLNGYAHGARYGDPTVDNGYIRVQLRHFDATKNYLWPIPQSELNLDKNLTQNPGY